MSRVLRRPFVSAFTEESVKHSTALTDKTTYTLQKLIKPMANSGKILHSLADAEVIGVYKRGAAGGSAGLRREDCVSVSEHGPSYLREYG